MMMRERKPTIEVREQDDEARANEVEGKGKHIFGA
jgi:hypothetical protein